MCPQHALCGHWQVLIKFEDQNKAIFTSHLGTFRQTRIPFGLFNAPSTSQRAFNIFLFGFSWKTFLVYIDDIIIYSKNIRQHVEDILEDLTPPGGSGIKTIQVSYVSKEN